MIHPISIHSSVNDDHRLELLWNSLETCQIHPRLLYESPEQSRKWLEIHKKYSPVQNRETFQIYLDAYEDAISQLQQNVVQIVSLGCGGGNKDAALVTMLIKHGFKIEYIPCDVSQHLVEEASSVVQKLSEEVDVYPLVCDLDAAEGIKNFVDKHPAQQRIVLFFGILPNMERSKASTSLSTILQSNDWLLLSANLSPGEDYLQGIQSIMPQYQNAETSDWLLIFLDQLKISRSSGSLEFKIGFEPDTSEFKLQLGRIEGIFRFKDFMSINVHGEKFEWMAGDDIRLFFSNRYTRTLVEDLGLHLGLKSPRVRLSSSSQEAILMGII
jgi:L-histidine N-alpha-methyltransferase